MSRKAKIEEMLEKSPDDVFLNFGLAMELAKEGDHDAALQRFDRTIELDADYAAAYFHKGNTLLQVSQTEAAKSVLQEGIAAAQRCGDTHAEKEMRELLETAD